MMRGQVNALHEAILPLRLRGPSGVEIVIDAIIDTGFDGTLTLPAADVAAMNLVRRFESYAALADGTIRSFDVYEADILWDGNWRRVLISEMESDALLGMKLLVGYEIRLAIRNDGAVEVTSLP